jgi:hypothetical protein
MRDGRIQGEDPDVLVRLLWLALPVVLVVVHGGGTEPGGSAGRQALERVSAQASLSAAKQPFIARATHNTSCGSSERDMQRREVTAPPGRARR